MCEIFSMLVTKTKYDHSHWFWLSFCFNYAKVSGIMLTSFSHSLNMHSLLTTRSIHKFSYLAMLNTAVKTVHLKMEVE